MNEPDPERLLDALALCPECAHPMELHRKSFLAEFNSQQTFVGCMVKIREKAYCTCRNYGRSTET